MSKRERLHWDERIACVAESARREVVPTFDVTHVVVRRLRQVRSDYAPERPLVWFTAAAMAAAALVLTLSMPYVDVALDPLTVFLEQAAASAI